jgi:hypothetical protein
LFTSSSSVSSRPVRVSTKAFACTWWALTIIQMRLRPRVSISAVPTADLVEPGPYGAQDSVWPRTARLCPAVGAGGPP